MRRRLSRRRFVATSLAAGAAVPSAFAMPAVRTRPKHAKTYRTALIGSGWWGTNIAREALASGRCELVAMCDVDARQIDQSVKDLKLEGERPKAYVDYRELLDEQKPEIVIIGTPDHWHPLQTIAAVRAGAHVYVEKPISHTIDEGKAMVKAARDADRIVQVGTHRRISPHNVEGMKFLKSGKAGKIGMIRAFVHYGGGPDQPTPNEEPPKELNWDLWCGPAPLRPYNRRITPKGFRDFLDYANGTLGDWGIHWMDQILWWTEELGPKTVYSTGGRPIAGPPVNDGQMQTGDAPDHQIAVFRFDGFDVSWEHRKFAGNTAEKTHPQQAVGCYFYGTEGTFHMGWLDGWTFYPADPKKAPIHMDAQLHEPDQQNIKELWADFLDCVDDRNSGGTKLPVSDIETGHRSTTMSLLGMLALKLGRSVNWDAEKQVIVGDPEANIHLRRVYRGGWEYPWPA
ncbi:MAG: oxidoreductase [Isosphaeraceae bacterium]|jgi:predicted dehydrogenase|nr:MAG: oxidoreductase [Isosphaeraceae bacterium]